MAEAEKIVIDLIGDHASLCLAAKVVLYSHKAEQHD